MPDEPHKPDPSRDGPVMTPSEKKHFWFAAILIFSCMLTLPILGAIWILLMRWGVIDRPQ